MTLSPINAFFLGLFPGLAEQEERCALALGDRERALVMRGIRFAREAVYLSSAIGTIATLGCLASPDTGEAGYYACAFTAFLGISTTLLSAEKLYMMISLAQALSRRQHPTSTPHSGVS